MEHVLFPLGKSKGLIDVIRGSTSSWRWYMKSLKYENLNIFREDLLGDSQVGEVESIW